jgi:hypothetical protein
MAGNGRRGKGVEVYPRGRYFTVTGDTVPGRKAITNIQAPLDELLAWIDEKREYPQEGKQSAPPAAAVIPPAVDVTTAEVIEHIRRSKQGELFGRLFDAGDTSAYGGDDSAADCALMNILPFWCGGDPEQMEEVFSLSALARRDKWSRADYRQCTIAAALKTWNGEKYDPAAMQKKRLERHEAARQEDKTILSRPEWPVTEVNDNGTVIPIKQAWENTAYLLDALGIRFRYNLLKKAVDVTGGGLDGLSFDSALAVVRGIMYKNRLKISRADLMDNIGAIAERNQYSPVCDYLNKCMGAWDGKDRIEEVFSCFELDDAFNQDKDFIRLLLRKWLISCARMAFNDGQEAAQGVLILVGKQGIGKTRFMYTIIPVPEWCADGLTLDPAVKDDVLAAIRFWVAELGEINDTLKKEKQDRLKQFFTHKTDNIRKPYGRVSEQIARRTVFIGTVNPNGSGFLKDSTGNRRYWPIAVKSINDKMNIDIKQLWGQLMQLAFVEKEPHWLNAEELERLQVLNEPFDKVTSEEQVLIDRLDWDTPENLWRWVTSTDLCDSLGLPRSRNSMIGRAVKNIAKRDSRIGVPSNHRNGRKYKVPQIVQPVYEENIIPFSSNRAK